MAKSKAVAGSSRKPVKGAKKIGKVVADESVTVTLRLRRANALKFNAAGPRARQPMTREKLAANFGGSAEDVKVVEEFAHKHGLSLGEVNLPGRTVILRGSAEAVQHAFNVELEAYETPEGVRYRQREGSVFVPDNLQKIVDGVFGLDNRPQAKPHFRVRTGRQARAMKSSFTPLELAKLYNFPKGTGKGQGIAIIELGGGYKSADMTKYFKALKIKAPKIVPISVDGKHNSPTGNPNGPDGEVVLDIQVAGAIAHGATILVYFAANTDSGFFNAITKAIHDPRTTVISISWGGPEDTWTDQMRTAFDDAFQDAAALGIPVFVAAGDDGSSDGENDGANHVDFPAASPYAIACGGTNLNASSGAVTSEVVWEALTPGDGATGGGFSDSFGRPAWQTGTVAGGGGKRGVPDVAGVADPATGYEILVDSNAMVIGGTSAVAPLWAGLAALCNQISGKSPGFLLPLLYKSHSAFRDITQGSNGAFKARNGWDACTGLGSPDGKALLSTVW